MINWNIQRAREVYSIAHWSAGYFDVNEAGRLVMRPDGTPNHPGVDLYDLTGELMQQGLTLPVLVRFSNILHHRVDTLYDAFTNAMKANEFEGKYTAVYPIKVNQQRSVVDEILSHGQERVGLEAGSKPELLAVLAHSRQEGGIIVCNGYKDREYLRLALIGMQLGHRVYIVIEKLSELELVIRESRSLNVLPLLGVRLRLSSLGAGKWQNTGGEKSKFGLSAAQVLRVIERLRENKMLESLQMMHFHMGSQIANIQDVQLGLREGARHYAELHHQGANIHVVNVGGGLGVDYEGTRSRSFCSMNYSLKEYANSVVHCLWQICAAQNIPHPDIVTESGRAMTAHHAVLITNLVDVEQAPGENNIKPLTEKEPQIIQDMWQGLNTLSDRSTLETYHLAVHGLSQARTMYIHGVISLEQRARAEEIFYATCWKVRQRLQAGTRAHREVLDELNENLSDKYFFNFSLFQSIPDHWAFKQIFPIVPLHRLDEPPTRRAVLQDLTCDSDGRVALYVDSEGVETSLPIHTPRVDEPYLIGIFLVGAYQEILGDMHNLFGDTDSVHVDLTDNGYRLSEASRGDSVGAVLRYVHFVREDLLAAYKKKVDKACHLEAAQKKMYLEELAAGLEGYTYLED